MPEDAAIHQSALCLAKAVGSGTRIGPFASLAADAVVGSDCAIEQAATIGPRVTLGDRVTVCAGARLVANVSLDSDVTVHENAVVGGAEATTVARGAVVGANATVAAGTIVGRGAVIEPGAAASDAVPANAVVRGNPAQIVGYVGNGTEPAVETLPAQIEPSHGTRTDTRVPNVYLHPLNRVSDLRGRLVAANFADLPFVPQRIFSVFDVPSERIRGSHAHRQCDQLLISLSGSIHCVIDDGTRRDEVRLDSPDMGLYLPAMTWGTQYKYTRDAVLLVLASHPYSAEEHQGLRRVLGTRRPPLVSRFGASRRRCRARSRPQRATRSRSRRSRPPCPDNARREP